jgi:tetratricopeptide (TPR) repeat protein
MKEQAEAEAVALAKVAGPKARRAGRAWGVVPGVVLPLVLAVALAAMCWTLLVRDGRPDLVTAEDYIASHKYAAAAKLAESYLTNDPRNTRALMILSRSRAALGDYEGIVDALRRISDESVKKPEALYVSGQALRLLGRGREAEEAFRACVARSPNGWRGHPYDARIQLLQIYGLEERHDDFVALAWDSYERMPARLKLNFLVMRTRLELEQAPPEVNAKTLATMVAKDSDDAHALGGLAAARAREGHMEEARELLTRAVALRPGDAELREKLMDVLQKLGRLDELAEVLADRPKGADERARTQGFLGIVAEASGDLDAAAAAFARASKLDPAQYEYPYKLSRILALQGKAAEAQARLADRDRIQKARAALREAWGTFADVYEADPGRVEPAMLVGMGRACEGLGWNREARAWYREATRRDPADDEARAALERLDARRDAAEGPSPSGRDDRRGPA